MFNIPPHPQVVRENKSLPGAFASVLGLLQNPVLDSRAIPTDGQPLEDQQHAHGNHNADGQAQTQDAQHQRDLGEFDGGQLVLSVVQVVVPVQATDQRAQKDVGGMTAANHGEREEVNEVGLVSPTDAIVYLDKGGNCFRLIIG